MHTYHDTQHSPYSAGQIFDLVIDIARYPEFLPWCHTSRIVEHREHRILAELTIGFKHLTERYVSEVTFRQPASPTDEGTIDVALVRGPFEYLHNHWKFTPTPEGGSTITLDLSFKFRSPLLDTIIGPLFGKASAKMAKAFKERADSLYGKKS